MLERKIYAELLAWKKRRQEDRIKKCLLIQGARQVSKSFSACRFRQPHIVTRENFSFLSFLS